MQPIRKIGLMTTAAVLTFGTLAQAAESGVDYQYKQFVNIASTNPSTPTVVNTVTVVCPAAGSLIATASTQITMATAGGVSGEATIQYGISKNSKAADINQHHLLQHYTSSGIVWASVHYQRTDTCTASQTVVYRFVAHRVGADTASAEASSLVVTFVGDPKI